MRYGLFLLLLTACGGPAASAPSDETHAGGEASAEAPTESPASRALPPSIAPAQGESAFGVYLVTAEDPARITAGMDRLEERGVHNAGSAELGCDRGAAEVLSLPESTVVLSVAFASEADATAFVEAWGEPVLGVAEFVAYCRD